MVGARGPCPPPLENEKKRLSEEILSSFTYVLLMKLGGGGIDIHCIPLPAPMKIKKKAVRGNFNNNYIAWVALHRLHCMGCIAWVALHWLHRMGCLAWVAWHGLSGLHIYCIACVVMHMCCTA